MLTGEKYHAGEQNEEEILRSVHTFILDFLLKQEYDNPKILGGL